MIWGFWRDRSRLCRGFVIVLLLFRPSLGTLDLESCMDNTISADRNRDGFLDMEEFLDLIELYDSTCTWNVTELSSKQLEVFMQLSFCPCELEPFASSSCCTPEASAIDVQVATKGVESLTLFEKAGLSLLCANALLLAQDLICSESRFPTYAPSLESSENPSQEKFHHPSIIPTTSPVLSSPPSQESPVSLPFSASPLRGPTDLPTILLTADEPSLMPTLPTDSPVLPPTTGLEIPVSVPTESPVSLPFSTSPLRGPTDLPKIPLTSDEPSLMPTLPTDSPVLPPTTGLEIPVSVPTASSPTISSPNAEPYLVSDCIEALISADSNSDQLLNYDEYTVFLRIFSGCTGIPDGAAFAFMSINCADFSLITNPVACFSSSIDISEQTLAQTNSIMNICDPSYFLWSSQECVDVPTLAPVQVPVVFPEPIPAVLPPTLQPRSLAPTGKPTLQPRSLAPTGKPTLQPRSLAPTGKPSANPRGNPQTTSPTASPISVGVPEFLACTSSMVSADVDSDSLLSQQEYLTFVKLQSACDSIAALSAAQSTVFLDFADDCLNAANADLNCALPRNARVSIEGARTSDELRTGPQRQNLLDLCTETEKTLTDTCPQAPTPIVLPPFSSPPFGAPITTLQPQTSPSGPDVPLPDVPVTIAPTAPVPDTIAPATPVPDTITPATPVPDTIAPATPGPDTIAPAMPPISEPALGVDPSLRPAINMYPTVHNDTSTVSPFPVSESPMDVPSVDSAIPTPTNVDSWPEDCKIAMMASDIDHDYYLNEKEFLYFIQRYSQCNLTTFLSDEQNTLFRTLACICLTVNGAPDCCFPGNAKVSIDGSVTSVSEICSLAADTLDEACVAPPTLDQCAEDLLGTDSDNDGLLTKDEYLAFIRKYGQDDSLVSLDLGHQSVFQTISCECVKFGANFDCCLPGNATLNISGADLPNANRSDDQITGLAKICLSADGLTARDCSAPLGADPIVNCANELVFSDINFDGYLDMDEYLLFLRMRYSDCAAIEWLSFTQRVSFSVLACSCLLQPGAQLECCSLGNARVDISGANLSDVDRTMEQRSFLSSVCKASNATSITGCRSPLSTFAPASETSSEVSAGTFVSSSEAVASSARRKYSQYCLWSGTFLIFLLWESVQQQNSLLCP